MSAIPGIYPHADLTERILGAAIEVHRQLGPGLLENTYRVCLIHQLGRDNLRAECEVPISIEYKGISLGTSYRADIIVEDMVLLELKAIECVLPIHEAQILTYLKLCRLQIGLLINFNVTSLKRGIRRFAR